MSYINCRTDALDVVRSYATRARGTGIAILVSDEVAKQIGANLLDGVPVITDPDAVVVFPAVDLSSVREKRKIETMEALWSFVDGVISPREREAMTGLFLDAQMTLILGGQVNPWALGVLAVTLGWCKGAMRQQEALTALIDKANDADAVAAVAPNFDDLGVPPSVTAGQISAMLAEV